jgi:SH3 domain protein
MKMASRPYAVAVFLWLCVVMSAARAETVYVADRFEIGVHENTNIDSVILAVIPSGTPLTVVDRDGNFVEVNTPDGIKGWVDARYVVNEKPSVALLEERDARLRNAERSLGDARAEVEVLRQRVTELQRDAATATQYSPDIAKPISLAPNKDSAKLKDAERQLENLAKENQQLKTRVTDLQAIHSASEKSAADSQAREQRASVVNTMPGSVSHEVRSLGAWQWLLLGSILLLAFGAGGYFVDWESRRRHGGFRI